AVLCLVKRSWALQGCNPTRDSQVRRENSPGTARGHHASGGALFLRLFVCSAMPPKTLSCLRARILRGVSFAVARAVATLLAVGRWRIGAVPVAHAIAFAGDV